MATFKVTRDEIMAARNPGCSWTEEILTANIERRFPGGKPIALAALIDAWLADKELSFGSLGQASFLAAALAPAPEAPEPESEDEEPGPAPPKPGGSFTRPRYALEKIRASLP